MPVILVKWITACSGSGGRGLHAAGQDRASSLASNWLARVEAMGERMVGFDVVW
jgi:hypothetical protein